MNAPKVNPEVNLPPGVADLPPVSNTTEPYGHNPFPPSIDPQWPQDMKATAAHWRQQDETGDPPMQSSQVEKLSEALARAQGMMKTAGYNRMNPHFKSRYADLAAVWDAIREPLAKNGLAVTQTIHPLNEALYLYTHLRHASGQWVSSLYPLPIGAKAQEFGSALTYARRYSLASIAGIASDEDDDAEAANKIEDRPLNKEQMEHLQLLIEETGTDGMKFLNYMAKLLKRDIAKLEDIPQSQFPTAFAALSKKVKATAP